MMGLKRIEAISMTRRTQVSVRLTIRRPRIRRRCAWLGILCAVLILGRTNSFVTSSFSKRRTSAPPRTESITSVERMNNDALIQRYIYASTCLQMATKSNDPTTFGSSEDDPNNKKKKKGGRGGGASNATAPQLTDDFPPSDMVTRIAQLEQIVSRQEVELRKLRKECDDLTEATMAFARVVELLRQAGLDAPGKDNSIMGAAALEQVAKQKKKDNKTTEEEDLVIDMSNYEYFDDIEIFGKAPASVTDAADSAGAAILAGMLGGKQRMLVDVRDAELSRDADTLVQFLELAILPVAAGLEGLKSTRNRVKIVFPTVSHLLQYRKTMALAAPEVVALSTLGFDPIEKQDQLVVIVAPEPDDEEGLATMNELVSPTDPSVEQIRAPLVVVNHHMVPLSGPAKDFEVAYHLRLLSVQYMSGDNAPEYMKTYEDYKRKVRESTEEMEDTTETTAETLDSEAELEEEEVVEEDKELEAAMKHAREIGMNQGVTRAMVIRAYPKPWHVFVDTSPDTDADFEVAATFDDEPTQDDVNFAIVECLEGSEREDELVAQQMQQALEAGQLDKVADMLGIPAPMDDTSDEDGGESDDLEDGDNFYNDFDSFEEDSC